MDIGSIMGIAPGTVAATLSKARARLGSTLEAEGLGPFAAKEDRRG